MAMEAKLSFLEQLRSAMACTLTVKQEERLRLSVMEILDHFEMVENRIQEEATDNLLETYIAAMRVENKSEKTIRRYEYEIRRMMDHVQVPTRRISVYHLRAYLAAGKERGLADSTLEALRQIFTAYFNWLQRECLIERNPTSNLGVIKRAKKEKKCFTPVEMDQLNEACETLRDRAIVHFLAATGCRISEMVGLNRDSVDLIRQECIVHGKGDKERAVFLDDVTTNLLKQYLSSRTDDEKALFGGQRGRLTPGGVRIMLNRLAKRAGVAHVHPHKFRRTLATNMARHGMPIQEVAHILGHEKVDTTNRYLVQNHEEVKANYRRYA